MKRIFKNYRFKKISAFIMTMCLLFSSMPISAINTAEKVQIPDEEIKETLALSQEYNDIIEPVILQEDETMRREYQKHFLCDDGSYMMITYPTPVHMEVDGQWVDIDYPLLSDNGVITASDETADISLKQSSTSAVNNDLVSVKTDSHDISWTVSSSTAVSDNIQLAFSSAEVKTSSDIKKQNKISAEAKSEYSYEEIVSLKGNVKTKLNETYGANTADKANAATDLENNTDVVEINRKIDEYNRGKILDVSLARSYVEYPNALGDGTILRYIVSPNKIKEEIILNSADLLSSYTSTMNISGLTAVLENDNSIHLNDEEDNTVFIVASPYMYDANNSDSYDIGVSIEQTGDICKITYTPDEKWLASPDRAFPVVIDPEFKCPNTTVEDYYVCDGVKTDNQLLRVGYINGKKCVAYWSLNDGEFWLPANTIYTGANFYIRLVNGTTTMGKIAMDSGSNRVRTISAVTSDLWLKFAGTGLIRDMEYLGEYSIPTLNLSLEYAEYKDGYNEFYSSDYTLNTNYIPYLSIKYTYPNNYESIPQGDYYIKNAKTNKYLTAKNAGTSNGTRVVQNSYNKRNNQVWHINTVGKTSYLYPLHASDKFLFWKTGYNLQIMTPYQTAGRGWRFEKTSLDTYLISPLAEPWRVLDVDHSSTEEDATIYVFPYHGQKNQQWELVPVKTVNLKVIYDEGYNTRVNGDLSFIQKCMDNFNKVYYERFGLFINYSSPAEFTSYADSECNPDPSAPCTHAANEDCYDSHQIYNGIQTLHHKNIYNILYRLPLPQSPYNYLMAFTGHITCSESGHSGGTSPAGVAVPDLRISILGYDSFGENIITPVHELGHLFGAPDHYGIGNAPSTEQINAERNTTNFNSKCIYGELREKRYYDLEICEGCRKIIQNNINAIN